MATQAYDLEVTYEWHIVKRFMENYDRHGNTDSSTFFMAYCVWFDHVVLGIALFPGGSS